MKNFSECWFKDCYHMALLPIVNEYLGNYDCLLFNQVYYYYIDDNVIKLKRIDFTNVYTLLKKHGITCQNFNEENIINTIIHNYCINDYVIVGIDNYYEKARKDYYQKKHVAHSLLITNINYENEEATILEQEFFFSNTYKKLNISFSELEEMQTSYLINKNKESFFDKPFPDICKINNVIPDISLFRKTGEDKVCSAESQKQFIQKIIKYNSSISSGIKYILEWNNLIGQNVKKGIADINYGNFIINALSEIILGKKEELAVMNKVLPLQMVEEFVLSQKSIISDWSCIRNKISKIIYSKEINQSYLEDIHYLLSNIYFNENANYVIFDRSFLDI